MTRREPAIPSAVESFEPRRGGRVRGWASEYPGYRISRTGIWRTVPKVAFMENLPPERVFWESHRAGAGWLVDFLWLDKVRG